MGWVNEVEYLDKMYKLNRITKMAISFHNLHYFDSRLNLSMEILIHLNLDQSFI